MSAPSPRYTPRQVASIVIGLLGCQTLLSAGVVNPWVAPLWLPVHYDRLDVVTSYCAVAVAIGLLLLFVARQLSHARSPRAGKVSLVIVMLSMLVLADRLVLVPVGLKKWKHDPVLHFTNRPNITRSLAGYGRGDEVIRFNRYGHLDDDFPVAKPPGEFRALMIGDSTTMGFGVPKEETIAHYLEDLLRTSDRRYQSHQIINTGVHGYNTTQELEMLRRSMRFEPDLIIIGFTLNDVTEPYIVDQKFGGTGLDYHSVLQTPNRFVGWLLTDTGVGRVLQEYNNQKHDYAYAKRQEEFTVREMVELGHDHDKYRQGWQTTLQCLDEMYAIGKSSNVPVVLIIFPFTFQIGHDQMLGPQRLVTDAATARQVAVIDVAKLLAPLLAADGAGLNGAARSDPKTVANVLMRRFYLDQNHLKAEGHQLVAMALFRQLARAGMIEVGR